MNHLKKIREKLESYGLEAMLVTSEPGEFYGISFHGEGVLLVTESESYYFTDGRYIEACRGQVTDCVIGQPAERAYRAAVKELIEKHKITTLGYEDGYMPVRSRI